MTLSTEAAEAGPTGSNPAIPPRTDCVTFGIDLKVTVSMILFIALSLLLGRVITGER